MKSRRTPPLLSGRVTELLIALVPLVVATVPILRWPTRERRLRTHLALLKDVPPDVDARALRSLVEKELRIIANRDARWMLHSSHLRRRELTARAMLSAVMLSVLVPIGLTADFHRWFANLTPELKYVVSVYGLAALIVFQWFVSTYSIRFGLRKSEKELEEAA